MGKKIPRWESELWSYLSSGDGMHCPLRSHCQARRQGGWCADDNREKLSQLIDSGGQFDSQNHNFVECEEKAQGIFQLVGKLAQQHLQRGRVRCPPVPTEIISLMDQEHPIQLRPVRLGAHHGAVWRLKDEWVIHLNKDETSGLQRFTIFHEAFHILAHAHCRTSPVFRKRGATQGSFNELLADYFAICLLMPREWVKEKWAQVKDLNLMAETFDVPKAAMGIRLRQLGLV